MSQKLSKTARASVQAGEGIKAKPVVAWGWFKKPDGGLRKRADISFFDLEEARRWAEVAGEHGYVVSAQELNANTQRR